MNDRSAKQLIQAIIVTACDDYRQALAEKDEAGRIELERFFRADWFGQLCDLDPDALIERLKMDADANPKLGGG